MCRNRQERWGRNETNTQMIFMKKLLIILAATIAIAACNNAADRETSTDTTTTTTITNTSNADSISLDSADSRFETAIIEAETSAASTIVDYAESKNVDLLIIGSRGRTGLKKMLVGSTASAVVKYAHCPVLVVR